MDLQNWDIEKALGELNQALADASTSEARQQLRNAYLSKKSGIVGQLFKALRDVPVDLKRQLGGDLNRFKKAVESAFKQLDNAPEKPAKKATFDWTLPGIVPEIGNLHPLTLVRNEIVNFFMKMGYDIAEGPEIETNFYNFEALNTPAGHPARDEADTFYIDDERLLRTQTSGMQIRYMENHKPPYRMLSPGRVYRRDDDVTHSPMFHQIEGLAVGENITFCDLKGTLLALAKHMFGPKTKVRLRPSFFPFTEPSAEVDASCPFCDSGCRICQQTQWIEILGCGMVDPKVFEAVGYDPEKYTGFAFGLGIERFAMLRFNVPDIRYFYQNDRRFLDHFKGV